ncbi:hypothetical protein HAX54_048781 [Datura stramonium]|uniref:Uncharacterized protein n=1 Tax=Datura stramonium TaxID=4076 RepID=A0ABS8WJM8_DATST|nr:hypothetical protein [Datura stramonium]
MPTMYESEVIELYSSLTFTTEEETVAATVGGVEIVVDSISLGKEAEIALLKMEKSGREPGAMLDLQNENAALGKQLEDLTHKMLCDQHISNERIDKLLSKF